MNIPINSFSLNLTSNGDREVILFYLQYIQWSKWFVLQLSDHGAESCSGRALQFEEEQGESSFFMWLGHCSDLLYLYLKITLKFHESPRYQVAIGILY